MKQLNKVVKKILTTVNSCQPAVKLDPQNLLNYTTLLDTNTSDHPIFNLHTRGVQKLKKSKSQWAEWFFPFIYMPGVIAPNFSF